ncbi:hypothetical protein BGW41_007796 [Actinomortierella wolfii]|nr:hypothetical protein BGW41_007796 [Actinomortierella wolfii]
MTARTRRAARVAAEPLTEKPVLDEPNTDHAAENIAPDASMTETRSMKQKASVTDVNAKPILREQDQNQTKTHNAKAPVPTSTLVNSEEPAKRKRGRPLKVVKAEDASTDILEQEDAAKDEETRSNAEDDDDDSEEIQDDPEDEDFTLRPKKQRAEQPRMVTPLKVTHELSEYERMRLENIRKNEEMLLALQLPTMSMKIQADTMEGKQVDSMDEPKNFAPMAGKTRKPRPPPKSPAPVTPSRTSNRLRGLKPAAVDENTEPTATRSSSNEDANEEDDENIDRSTLMAADVYFDEETRKKAIRVDGHYKGWINKDVMERYGFEKSAAEAWEANGGGTFSFRDPAGAGRSKKFNAKEFAKAMFKKNPNAYFYRHNEPGEDQWTGDWTPEERELFLEVARQYGCGDKWGLFASHIPHRVGYQCSNYYRQVILPEGLVFDPNYEFTSNGRPIYCGKYNQRR